VDQVAELCVFFTGRPRNCTVRLLCARELTTAGAWSSRISVDDFGSKTLGGICLRARSPEEEELKVHSQQHGLT
jgi:hypothetical protein